MNRALTILVFLAFTIACMAQNVGIGTTTPSASAQLDLTSTSKGFLPPRMTTEQREAITPVEGLIIYNTSLKRPNYYNGTEWRNFDETSAVYGIGYPYQGGIIAYLFQPGDPGYVAGQFHGLIVPPFDQSTGAQWGCNGTTIPGADGLALGTGNQNTIDIMAGCSTSGIAARICGDLVLNGYSDWYLPSHGELYKMYLNRVAIGGFAFGTYWSSSEESPTDAFTVQFGPMGQQNETKATEFPIRACRTF